MATYYWVGGAGNWDNSSTTNWSLTSGGAGGAGAPTSADNVIFNASSGTGRVLVQTGAICNDLTASAVTTATTFSGVSAAVEVYGSVNFGANATNTVSTEYFAIDFEATTTGKTLTCAATGFLGDLSFVGTGGGWTVSGALTCQNIRHYRGTLNTNGQTINVGRTDIFGGSFGDLSQTDVKVLTLGASVINIGTSMVGPNAQPSFSYSSGGNFTLNANTSTINLGNTTAGATNAYFNGDGKTYATVSLRGTFVAMTGTNTFTSLSRIGAADTISRFYVGANQTVTTTFIVQGNNGTSTNTPNRLFVLSDNAGVSRSITLTGTATRTVQEVDFADINLVFGSSVTGTRVGDCLGNTNITFTAARTLFARSAGAARSWSGTATALWATTTGGSASTANGPPLPQDSITLDATSGAAALTLDMPRLGNAFTTTGFTGSFVVSAAEAWIFGAITGATSALNGVTVVIATRTNTILSNYAGSTGGTIIYSPGATIRMGVAITNAGGFTISAGTFNTNDGSTTYNLTALSIVVGSAPQYGTTQFAGPTVTLNSSTVTITTSSWTLSNSAATINAGTSTIDHTSNSGANKTFAGGGKTYYNVRFSTSVQTLYNLTGNNTFNDLINNSSTFITVYGPASGTTTVANLSLGGAKGRGAMFTVGSAVGTTLAITQNVSTSFLGFVSVTKSGAFALSASGVADLGGNTGITSTSLTRTLAFSNAGATSFTVPVDIASSGSSALFTFGGGGGAGKRSTSTGSAGSGGSAAAAVASNLNVTSGQTVYVTVGAAGVGATTSGAGTAGGTSWANITANSQPAALANGTYAAGGGGSAGVASTGGGAAAGLTPFAVSSYGFNGLGGSSGNASGAGGPASSRIQARSSSGAAGTHGGGGGSSVYAAGVLGTATANGGAGGVGSTVGTGGTGGAGGNPPTAGGAGTLGGGGGGGGGSTAATVNSAAGGAGSNSPIYTYNVLNGVTATGTIGPGGGGGGGGGISSTALSGSTGGAGGNGGIGAGGGGGGRGSTTSGATGNGGNGGTGLVLFIYETSLTAGGGNRGFIIG